MSEHETRTLRGFRTDEAMNPLISQMAADCGDRQTHAIIGSNGLCILICENLRNLRTRNMTKK